MLKNENKRLSDELEYLKKGKEEARQIEFTILEKTIPVLQKEKEDLMNQLASKEALAEGSKKLARLVMDENYDLKSQIESLLRPDMAVPSAQEQSKKALADLRDSYEKMFENLIAKVNQIQKEGERVPQLEQENSGLLQEVSILRTTRSKLAVDLEEDRKVGETNSET